MTIDEKIRKPSAEDHRTLEEWSEIVRHLVHTLSNYLQQEVKSPTSSVAEAVIDGEALCWPMRSASISDDPLAFAWEGTLGLEVIDGKVDVSASLFLFSQGKRVSIAGHRGSYFELAYEFDDDDGAGHWHSLGWVEDIYGEYEAFDAYTGDC